MVHADADAPVVPVEDLCVLGRQWPLSVVSGMSRKQTDYESLRHECKRSVSGKTNRVLFVLWNGNQK